MSFFHTMMSELFLRFPRVTEIWNSLRTSKLVPVTISRCAEDKICFIFPYHEYGNWSVNWPSVVGIRAVWSEKYTVRWVNEALFKQWRTNSSHPIFTTSYIKKYKSLKIQIVYVHMIVGYEESYKCLWSHEDFKMASSNMILKSSLENAI